MNHSSFALPWELSEATIKEIVGVHSSASISIVKPPRPFGGYNGEKALVRVGSHKGVSREVFLKKVPIDQAQREMHAYKVLDGIDAPVVTCYGMHVLPDDEAVLFVEYLPHTVDWPIPEKLHLDWATALAKLARCSFSKDMDLPQFQFFIGHDKILDGVEKAIAYPNPELKARLQSVNLNNVLSIVRDSLQDFLAEIDGLPQGLTHGECYSAHIGRRKSEDPVLFFDVATAGIRPRFFDLQGLIVDHGEPYEIDDINRVLRQFWDTYGQDVSYDAFFWEVKRIEGLIALRNIGVQLDFLHRSIGEAWQDGEAARRGHLKWIYLSFKKADEVLTEWEVL